MRRRLVVVAALATALAAREASGDIYHFKTPSTVTTDGGATLRLPPGYFLDEEKWAQRDAEMRRLQEQETRLKGENRSLRGSASAGPSIAFWTLTFAIGAFTGLVGFQMLK